MVVRDVAQEVYLGQANEVTEAPRVAHTTRQRVDIAVDLRVEPSKQK